MHCMLVGLTLCMSVFKCITYIHVIVNLKPSMIAKPLNQTCKFLGFQYCILYCLLAQGFTKTSGQLGGMAKLITPWSLDGVMVNTLELSPLM